MKFAKGLLSEDAPGPEDTRSAKVPSPQPQTPSPERPKLIEVEKNRLFQTIEETKGSSRKYVAALGGVATLVAVIGAGVWYLNRPGIGDSIRVNAETELAVRDHFLTKEKREVTNVSFYQCDGFYWARVGVVTRTDIPNPIYQIASYKARVTENGETTMAVPIVSPADDIPCS